MFKKVAELEKAILTPDASTAYFSIEGETGHPNEDRLKVYADDNQLKACIADGHWGNGAAEYVTNYWLGEKSPTSREEAVKMTKSIEEGLFELYGTYGLNPEKDFTPEAGFINAAIGSRILSVTAYGDCGLLIVNNRQVRYELPQRNTWLGAFSKLGIRNRIPIEQALIFDTVELLPGDYVTMFTDGLDDWEHEDRGKNVSSEDLARFFDSGSAAGIAVSLGELALINNALDDVSVFVHEVL